MKKGYTVILSLRCIKELKIETEKEDEEEIKEDARQCFIEDLKGMCGGGDVFENFKAVKIERNYSEDPEFQKWREEDRKDYLVEFYARNSGLTVTVQANDEEEALEKAESEMTTCFTSEDGNTDCEVFKYELSQVLKADWEKEDLA